MAAQVTSLSVCGTVSNLDGLLKAATNIELDATRTSNVVVSPRGSNGLERRSPRSRRPGSEETSSLASALESIPFVS
jgi:hypothetical protein